MGAWPSSGAEIVRDSQEARSVYMLQETCIVNHAFIVLSTCREARGSRSGLR